MVETGQADVAMVEAARAAFHAAARALKRGLGEVPMTIAAEAAQARVVGLTEPQFRWYLRQRYGHEWWMSEVDVMRERLVAEELWPWM